MEAAWSELGGDKLAGQVPPSYQLRSAKLIVQSKAPMALLCTLQT